MKSLQGKVAIVTGGSRGIGRAIVSQLALNGAKVAFTYVSASSAPASQELCSELQAKGCEVLPIQADSVSLQTPQKIIALTTEEFGSGLDILVNNAGVGGNTALESITQEEYHHLMDVNVRSVLFMTQAFVEHVRPGGRIINMSSVSARGGYATQSVYAATKAAVEAMTRVWARELGQKYQITVNAVNPGPVDTDMYRAAGEVHLARMAEENRRVPAAARPGTPQDIADIILFLCEERSRWVTGDVVCANGGMLFL